MDDFIFLYFSFSCRITSGPHFLSPLCMHRLIFLRSFTQLSSLNSFPSLVIQFSVSCFVVTRISSPHFQHYSCFKSLTHSPFQPDTLIHKSTYSPCPICSTKYSSIEHIPPICVVLYPPPPPPCCFPHFKS
jgi:hypothetical protein